MKLFQVSGLLLVATAVVGTGCDDAASDGTGGDPQVDAAAPDATAPAADATVGMACTPTPACDAMIQMLNEEFQSAAADVDAGAIDAGGFDIGALLGTSLPACCTDDLECGIDTALLSAINPSAAGGCEDPETYLDGAAVPDTITLDPSCASASVPTGDLEGCCMASGECGFSTHTVADLLALEASCSTGAELNAALASSPLAAFVTIPDSMGACGGDASVPPVDAGTDATMSVDGGGDGGIADAGDGAP